MYRMFCTESSFNDSVFLNVIGFLDIEVTYEASRSFEFLAAIDLNELADRFSLSCIRLILSFILILSIRLALTIASSVRSSVFELRLLLLLVILTPKDEKLFNESQ